MSLQSNDAGGSAARVSTSPRAGLLTQHRLPQQVFAETAANDYLFFEYAHAFSVGAWHLFVRMAREYGDRGIWFTTLDPDANEYYTTQFGSSVEAWFQTEAPATEYVQHMFQWPAVSIADAPAYRADVAIWIGDTGRWRCWGERSPNVCVLQLPQREQLGNERLHNELVDQAATYIPILRLEEVLGDIICNEYDAAEFEHFSAQFRRNYAP
jgi:hypothetical protein